MKFVFTKPPPDVKPMLTDFRQSVEQSLDLPLTLNLYESQFYSKDGALDFSSTRYVTFGGHMGSLQLYLTSFLSTLQVRAFNSSARIMCSIWRTPSYFWMPSAINVCAVSTTNSAWAIWRYLAIFKSLQTSFVAHFKITWGYFFILGEIAAMRAQRNFIRDKQPWDLAVGHRMSNRRHGAYCCVDNVLLIYQVISRVWSIVSYSFLMYRLSSCSRYEAKMKKVNPGIHLAERTATIGAQRRISAQSQHSASAVNMGRDVHYDGQSLARSVL